MRKTLAALALAAGFAPVKAQVSVPVTNFLNDSVMLAQADTAGSKKMAKDKFNSQGGREKMVPNVITANLPAYENEKGPLAAKLDQIQPGLTDNLNTAVFKLKGNDGKTINLRRRHAETSPAPYMVTCELNNGNDFVHIYQDLPGQRTHATFNFQRKQVATEEDFKKLQGGDGGGERNLFQRLGDALGGGAKETISPHARWAGPGKYMLNGFIAQHDGRGYNFEPLDPYRYMEHLQYKLDKDNRPIRDKKGEATYTNLNSPEVQQGLAHFNPQLIGLSLDPSVAKDKDLFGEVHMRRAGPGGPSGGASPQRPQQGVIEIR